MVKIVIALVLLFLAGGSWLYLDCLNRQELAQAQSLQQDVQQARTEARKRAELKAQFDSQSQSNLQSGLKSCQDAADKANADYMALLRKTMPSKRGVVVIPQATLDAADAILSAAKSACQQEHDDRMKQQS
ncbi:MAG TPA: hypothetical protein VIU93_13705 [Gallionellaceae bacterium]